MMLSAPLDPDQELPARPLALHEEVVRPEWIDYNGHMNVAYYVLAFDHATDRLLDLIGLGMDYARSSGHSTFVLETHVTYAQEVKLRDRLRFRAQLLDADAKRLHYFIEMHQGKDGYLAATSEQIALHVDLAARRGAPIPDAAMRRVQALLAVHRDLPRPEAAGRVIGIRRERAA